MFFDQVPSVVRFLSSLILGVLIGAPAFAKVETVIGPVALKKNVNLAGFLPTTNLPEIIISRDQYVISYNKEKRAPNFAVWKLEAAQIGHSGRSPSFTVDSELETYLQSSDRSKHAISPAEFDNTCFDRGHVVPSGDRSDTSANNKETFMMSNMIAQTPFLNRVAWEHLEQHTRNMVQQQNKKAYVIAGPIYDQNIGGIGPNKDIQVPTREFKLVVILDASAPVTSITKDTPMIAVILPNVGPDGKTPIVNGPGACPAFNPGKVDVNDWAKYKSSVQEIESLTGLKIFSPL